MIFNDDDDSDFDFEVADNPAPRCPAILLLDNSYSMDGEPIKELNEGISSFQKSILSNEVASLSIELSVVTFGGEPEIVHDFSSIDKLDLVNLSVKGTTPMGKAITVALDSLEKRKNKYKRRDLDYYQPWLVLITDGEPNDDYKNAASRARNKVERNELCFIVVGVENANMEKLKEIAHSDFPPVKLKTADFQALFKFLSDSLSRSSTTGEQTTKYDFDKWRKSI
jgi:uncharacterized protein YegL